MPVPYMDPVLTAVTEALSEMGIRPDAKILAGVSGGLDSMVLLYILHDLRYDVTAGHVNFQLRGEASAMDAHFVEEWCCQHSIPFLLHTIDTKQYAADFQLNTQLAARDIRYSWWNHLVQAHGFDAVATAHHLDDAIETVLMNLMRGTGLKGLQGIPYRRDVFIRPLLNCTRKELEVFARVQAIPFRTDETNLLDTYVRNRVRHHLVPEISHLYPGFHARFRHTFQRIRKEWADIDHLYRTWTDQHIQPHLDGFMIRAEEDHVSFLLRWLEEKGIPWSLAAQYVMAKNPESGTSLVYERLRLSRTAIGFFLEEEHAATEIVIPGTGYYALGDIEFSIEKSLYDVRMDNRDPGTAYMSGDVIRWPLHIRQVVSGDRFQPFGMEGKSKKLQDLMVDLKLEPFEKSRLLVLANDEHILWVMGIRLDERAKVKDVDKEYYKMVFSRKPLG